MDNTKCRLVDQGYKQASCFTFFKPEKGVTTTYREDKACRVTLKWEEGRPLRKVKSVLLSRPEDYLSIYQSGCNFSCRKCHSWEFSQYQTGEWISPEGVARLAREYAEIVTVKEPKEKATSFHALSLCRNCGQCVLKGNSSNHCPQKLKPSQVIFSPQGYGPARNMVAFTGGDLSCRPEWYAQSAEKIKEENLDLWVLLETNGYGLTPQNLDLFKSSGIDSFWLDIKAWDNEIHRELTGVENSWILQLPEEITRRGFTLEVLSLYIPGWVETEQIREIASLLAETNREIAFTILAFFGEYQLKGVPAPSLPEMLEAYQASKETGLSNIKLGNLGQFVKSPQDYKTLLKYAAEAI